MRSLAFIFLISFHLTLADTSEPPFPEIRITISDAQFKKLLGSRGTKLDLKDATMTINGDTGKVKEIHSRGNNSLNFQRKSLAVSLSNSVSIRQDGKEIILKHFNLLNLEMDFNAWHNRWAFLTMADLGIFPLYNSYCKLWINGKHHGIYLLVEKPSSYAKNLGSAYTIRRGPEHKIDKEYVNTDSKEEAKKYKSQYNEIYQVIRQSKGEDLYNKLSSRIDLKNYFTWLAFNYLTMNGDYADEVFMFIHPETKTYTVIPWDYDDIIQPSPHEGWEKRNSTVKGKLIFSSEENLDVAIVNDVVVYQHYIQRLNEILQLLSEVELTQSAKKVMDELRTLTIDPEVGRSTLFLGRDTFDMNKAEKNITTSITILISRRNGTLAQLKN